MIYRRINRITGFLLFLIATTVYTLTVEETVSLWDCGEFIAAAYKLQVPHPPGAPFFLLLGRMFSFLAGDNTERVAFWINMISVISSGATIMFLYWTTTLLGMKILKVSEADMKREHIIGLVGSGTVSALAYTFSDSFWFSATEAEVYGLSSFFTAFVFWAILKWEHIHASAAHRWLILIAYMMGLSIGVHLLNLVTIPALALIYYFNRYQTSRTGIIITLLVSMMMIGVIMVGIIPGLPSLAGAFEIFFVNSLGLPFGTGFIMFGILILGSLIYGLYYSVKNKKALLNTALLALTFILIGYSSYALVLIRSNFDLPIDENNPETIISFVSYLKREQYGSRPLLYGPNFTADLVDQKQGKPVYEKGEHQYIVTNYKLENVYDPEQSTLFPRLYSKQDNHPALYRQWMGLKPHESPDFGDNLSFFFRYQLGHMYLRYFMWNFAGRESDIQHAGWLAPWESKKDLPESMADNKARNNFFMLPLILGLIGLFYQFKKDLKGFSVVGLLFILTGIGLVVYLNSPPVEPRERDYIYVGSYYVFAIWIGFGVMAVAQGFARILQHKAKAGFAATLICLSVPLIMGIQGWDDHDRSGRYFALDMARNYLASCAPNAILFTGGDNDTFPLWYLQEVEGFRTDVRVIVLSYANTDWYIEQMKRSAYDSEPLPLSLTKENYKQGGPNDYLPYIERPGIQGAISLKQYMKLIRDDSPALQMPNAGFRYNIVPSDQFYLDVETTTPNESNNQASTSSNNFSSIPETLREIIPSQLQHLYTDRMHIRLKGKELVKNDLMLLDLILTNKWQRPIYFNPNSLQGTNLDLSAHVVQEGMTFRLLPVENPDPSDVLVNSETMYNNLMQKFSFRQLDNPDIYYSTEDHMNRGVAVYRQWFNELIDTLIREGKEEKAKAALHKYMDNLLAQKNTLDFSTVQVVKFLFQLNEQAEAIALSQKLHYNSTQLLDYYLSNAKPSDTLEINRNLFVLHTLAEILKSYQAELAQAVSKDLYHYYQAFENSL
ncbi:glycosyltransferase family 117 protein [Catalinimonas niigatensis]|uniref:glycosyltransferase family 117 protein n=1 Tax=Catalinimonas niigatensis TaxID=1397264 RepID=UPI0026658DBB|nr:DUF2723 domain-containing protein [Catalinimonas niigatensis]WPP52821.1 DUF2723 domain-containing protein [Catalinimonas niigatensis]